MEHSGTVIIETERLHLRRFEQGDAAQMFACWASDAEVTKFLRWPAHTDIAETNKTIAFWLNQYVQKDFYNWAVEIKATGELIGSISAFGSEPAPLEVGYCFGRAHWGKGYATEALKAVVSHISQNIGAKKLTAMVAHGNGASSAVLRKAGFKYAHEGVTYTFDRKKRYECEVLELALN